MASHEAFYYKLVPEAVRSHHEMAPLALLHSLGRDDVIAFASGSIGTWTRLVAPRLGAPVVYGAAGSTPAAPGQLAVGRLIDDYNMPELGRVEALFGLVGDRVEHSLSPRIHNGLYKRLGIPALYVPFQVEEFGDFWIDVVESGSFDELSVQLKGLSITSPHKRIGSAVAGARSPLVDLIGSSNTLVYRDEVWEAESTDGEGVVASLTEAGVLVAGKGAAVVGAGGAGRSVVVALSQAGANVTLVNRSVEAGVKAAQRVRVPFRSLEGFDPGEFELVVHATSLGSNPEDPLPFEPSRLARESVLVDMVYTEEGPSDLVREARSVARIAIDGRVPLLHQARPQFRLMTGQDPSIETLRDLVGL
jgi:3-dehydroquinate dehydratase/shikimate dehydrogenase